MRQKSSEEGFHPWARAACRELFHQMALHQESQSYPHGWSTELCTLDLFFHPLLFSQICSNIVVCSLCLKSIISGKTTSHLGTTCMKRHLNLHHKGERSTSINKRSRFSSLFLTFHSFPLQKIVNLLQHLLPQVIGGQVPQGVSEAYHQTHQVVNVGPH